MDDSPSFLNSRAPSGPCNVVESQDGDDGRGAEKIERPILPATTPSFAISPDPSAALRDSGKIGIGFGRKLLGGVFIAAFSPIASHAGTGPKAKRERSPGAQIISGQHSPQGGAKGAAIAVDPKRRQRSRLRPVLKATSICQLHQAGALLSAVLCGWVDLQR